MEVDPKTRCVRFHLYSSQDTHANQLVQPLSSDDESDPDQLNEEVFSGVLSEENGDEEEYSNGDDDVSDSDEDVDDDDDDEDEDEEADEDEDDQENTSHYITKPVIASGDSIHSGLPKKTTKEFVSVLNNICPNFSVLAHNNLLIEMIFNGDIAFASNSLISGADLKALYGRGPLSSSESKWLSNFVIVGYLELVMSESGLKIEVLTWEQFDRGVGNKSAAEITKGKGSLTSIVVFLHAFMQDAWLVVRC